MTSITRILGRAVLLGSLALVLTLRPAADARAAGDRKLRAQKGAMDKPCIYA